MADLAEIETFRKVQFASGIQHLAQQKQTFLRSLVDIKTVDGKMTVFDQVVATVLTKKAGRDADTPQIPIGKRRRALVTDTFHTGTTVDKKDLLTILNDPRSAHAVGMAMAGGRNTDDVIILAADASSRTGETGSELVALPPGQTITTAGTISIVKMLAAKRILDVNEEEDMDRAAVLSSFQFEDLLNINEVKNSDFNTTKALAMGAMGTYLGFDFVRSERLLFKTGAPTVRKCLFFQKLSIAYGEGDTPFIGVDQRTDKSYTWQIYYATDQGATRMDETGMVIMENDQA